MNGLVVTYRPDGSTRMIYDDALRPLVAALGGTSSITRVSHVEPHPRGGWWADMSPVGGPVLGFDHPFALRADALAAEIAWLRQHGY